jgi:hypothetical protein
VSHCWQRAWPQGVSSRETECAPPDTREKAHVAPAIQPASQHRGSCAVRNTVVAMIRREMEAWSRWASPDSVSAVAHVAIDAMHAWPTRMSGNWELADLAPPCPCVWEWPTRRRQAAALAAAEMAIVCHIWPEQLDEVLGRRARYSRDPAPSLS